MKKTSIWLSISTLVLCLGVMITGVYSALSASLNMNGTLGFNMHNATVTVQGSIQNVAQSTDNWQTASPITKTLERTIMGGETTTTTNLDLEDLYFYAGSNMIFTFTFTNISETAIQATFPLPTVGDGVTILIGTANGYTEFTDGEYTTTIAVEASTTVSFALTMENGTLGENILFNWSNITFEEYVPAGYTVNIKVETNTREYEPADVPFHISFISYSINGSSMQNMVSDSFELQNLYSIEFIFSNSFYMANVYYGSDTSGEFIGTFDNVNSVSIQVDEPISLYFFYFAA